VVDADHRCSSTCRAASAAAPAAWHLA
jgi:hypothetical protein